jgi:hypothetical protein
LTAGPLTAAEQTAGLETVALSAEPETVALSAEPQDEPRTAVQTVELTAEP